MKVTLIKHFILACAFLLMTHRTIDALEDAAKGYCKDYFDLAGDCSSCCKLLGLIEVRVRTFTLFGERKCICRRPYSEQFFKRREVYENALKEKESPVDNS